MYRLLMYIKIKGCRLSMYEDCTRKKTIRSKNTILVFHKTPENLGLLSIYPRYTVNQATKKFYNTLKAIKEGTIKFKEL